jgi:hypothetical protein
MREIKVARSAFRNAAFESRKPLGCGLLPRPTVKVSA